MDAARNAAPVNCDVQAVEEPQLALFLITDISISFKKLHFNLVRVFLSKFQYINLSNFKK